jgi:hypothetical protein
MRVHQLLRACARGRIGLLALEACPGLATATVHEVAQFGICTPALIATHQRLTAGPGCGGLSYPPAGELVSAERYAYAWECCVVVELNSIVVFFGLLRVFSLRSAACEVEASQARDGSVWSDKHKNELWDDGICAEWEDKWAIQRENLCRTD